MIGKRAKSDKSAPTDLACWDKFFAAKPLIPARFARFSWSDYQIRRSFPELHFGGRNVKEISLGTVMPDRRATLTKSGLYGEILCQERQCKDYSSRLADESN
jgi:hypothetical protein